MTVGHLPREDAAVVHRYLTAVQAKERHAHCEGRIVIASNDDYSIYLHLAGLQSVASVLRSHAGVATTDDPVQTSALGQEGHKRVGITGGGTSGFSAAELEDARMAYQKTTTTGL